MNSEEVDAFTIGTLARQIENRAISPVEVARAFLDRIERFNPLLNAYTLLCAEEAIEQAKKAEQEIMDGRYLGPLHGVPVSIKDNLATRGLRTTAGSKHLADWVPEHDATAVTRLRNAGAVILGKTNMHEWASGGTTINPYYGTTHNPWDLDRIAGGSSGGSAAAVAAGLCLGSLGTDNAGSVRNPAAMCGVVGLKPTHGRVSRFGGVAGTGGYSTDHFGSFTRSVEDCAVVLQAIAGYDVNDPLSSQVPVGRYTEGLEIDPSQITLGIIRNYFEALASKEVREGFFRAITLLKSLGMRIREVTIPHMKLELLAAVRVCTSGVESVSAHEPYLRSRPRDYGSRLFHRHVVALTMPASAYVTAQRVRRVLHQEFDQGFGEVDLFVTPMVAIPTPTIAECEEGFAEIDGVRVPLQDSRGSLGHFFSMPFNVTGHPAMTVPCGFTTLGLPMGLQFVARAFDEGRLFGAAQVYEKASGWTQHRPQIKVPSPASSVQAQESRAQDEK